MRRGASVLLFLAFVAPFAARAQIPVAVVDCSATVGTTSAVLESGAHYFLLVHNPGAGNIGISLGTADIGAAGTITIAAGGSLELSGPAVPANPVNVIAASASQPVTCWYR